MIQRIELTLSFSYFFERKSDEAILKNFLADEFLVSWNDFKLRCIFVGTIFFK